MKNGSSIEPKNLSFEETKAFIFHGVKPSGIVSYSSDWDAHWIDFANAAKKQVIAGLSAATGGAVYDAATAEAFFTEANIKTRPVTAPWKTTGVDVIRENGKYAGVKPAQAPIRNPYKTRDADLNFMEYEFYYGDFRISRVCLNTIIGVPFKKAEVEEDGDEPSDSQPEADKVIKTDGPTTINIYNNNNAYGGTSTATATNTPPAAVTTLPPPPIPAPNVVYVQQPYMTYPQQGNFNYQQPVYYNQSNKGYYWLEGAKLVLGTAAQFASIFANRNPKVVTVNNENIIYNQVTQNQQHTNNSPVQQMPPVNTNPGKPSCPGATWHTYPDGTGQWKCPGYDNPGVNNPGNGTVNNPGVNNPGGITTNYPGTNNPGGTTTYPGTNNPGPGTNDPGGRIMGNFKQVNPINGNNSLKLNSTRVF